MPSITSDQIRDISVKTVEGFLNNKIPLSEGLAKQASALQMNSEQIHRSVEATNQIAYLKVLELSSDRTVEFPLCKYAEVMAKVAMPETTVAPTASFAPSPLLKAASDNSYIPRELEDAELRVAFVKQASINDAQLQALKDRAVTILPEMIKVAKEVKKDARGLLKLATVAKGDEFKELSIFVYGKEQVFADTGMFKSAELKSVTALTHLVKEAHELRTAIQEKQALSDRSALIKEAFLGAVGSAIGRTAATIASKPFKMLGKGIFNSAANVSNKAVNAVKGKLGMPTTPIAKKLGVGAAIIPAATIGFDASMYQPGTSKDTGTSHDVWTSLQR